MTPLIPYLIACIIVAFLGRKKRIGFWGFLLLAVLFTPLLALIVLLLGTGKSIKN